MDAGAAAPDAMPGEPDDPACPTGMALVEGSYCLAPEQRCVEVQEIKGAPPEGARGHCLRYAEPVTCFEDRRRPMRFCMDRYEWPNARGAMPRVLTSWEEARALCASAGKRLCTEAEFNFACEGEEMRPHVYGYARDAAQCNFDRPYRPRTFVFTPWDACMADPACRQAFEALDQRMPAGSLESCRSREGVYDLIGNVNEWVIRPDERSPRRSGIKGGWWGPIRARCRPTVTFHDEGDFGYEVGFRCCADSR
jgi:formylglycine-generating enzyme required for sulfatase activity